MTLQELLKAQNLTDEQVKGILDAMKQNKIYTASEENLDVRYGKLKTDHDAMVAKDAESQKLIAELQKATKGQEDVQTKITEYEATIQKQQEELAEAKTESALKIGLLSAGAKATDIDYLIYKMNHDSDWKPELGEDGQVKGLDDKVKGLKHSSQVSLNQLPLRRLKKRNSKSMKKMFQQSQKKTSKRWDMHQG